jgi:hypothetical protein
LCVFLLCYLLNSPLKGAKKNKNRDPRCQV